MAGASHQTCSLDYIIAVKLTHGKLKVARQFHKIVEVVITNSLSLQTDSAAVVVSELFGFKRVSQSF